jgi:maltooligosyltrehalose trehalohydrolase
MLLAPAPPLLFMGEEWGAQEPFPFFCDFQGDLAEAVRNGRRKEFAEAYERHKDEVPDPLTEDTFRRAALDWSALDQPRYRARFALVRHLLTVRASFIVPRLPQLDPGHGRVEFTDGVLTAHWSFRTGERLSVLANLSEERHPRPENFIEGEAIWGGRPPPDLPPWSVFAAIGPN